MELFEATNQPGLAHALREILDPPVQGGMDPARRDIAQRLEHEGALVQSRVRHAEPRLVDLALPVEEEIQIQCAGGVNLYLNSLKIIYYRNYKNILKNFPN